MQVLKVPTENEEMTAPRINFSPLARRYTLEEFWALPRPEDHARYELIGGYLFMVPPPNPPHGDVAAQMIRSLMKFIIDNNIEGQVHFPPEPIWRRAKGSTYLEPDMMYVSNSLRAQMGDKRTSADIVFEFISRSTRIYDHTTKADTYLALGVRELWLVNPFTATIEVRYAHHETKAPRWEVCIFPRGKQARSRVLDGWKVSVSQLFDGLV